MEVEGSEVEGHPQLHCKFKAEWSKEVTRKKQISEAEGKSVCSEENVCSGCRFEERRFYKASLGTLIWGLWGVPVDTGCGGLEALGSVIACPQRPVLHSMPQHSREFPRRKIAAWAVLNGWREMMRTTFQKLEFGVGSDLVSVFPFLSGFLYSFSPLFVAGVW